MRSSTPDIPGCRTWSRCPASRPADHAAHPQHPVRRAEERGQGRPHGQQPGADAELPKAVQPKVKIWTAEQLGAFLDATEKERLYPLYHLAAFAGMRRGELCGISWDDVDLDKSRITVRWQITDQNYRNARARREAEASPPVYRTKPKTRAGEDRIVDLDAVSTEVLRGVAGRTGQGDARSGDTVYPRIRRARTAGPTTSCSPERMVLRSTPAGPTLEFARLVRDGRAVTPQAARAATHQHLAPARSRRLRVGHRDGIGHTSPALIRSTYGHLIGTVGQRAAEATAALVPRKGKKIKRRAQEGTASKIPSNSPTKLPRTTTESMALIADHGVDQLEPWSG